MCRHVCSSFRTVWKETWLTLNLLSKECENYFINDERWGKRKNREDDSPLLVKASGRRAEAQK